MWVSAEGRGEVLILASSVIKAIIECCIGKILIFFLRHIQKI